MPRKNEFNSTHHELTSRIAKLEAGQKEIQLLLNEILITLSNKSLTEKLNK